MVQYTCTVISIGRATVPVYSRYRPVKETMLHDEEGDNTPMTELERRMCDGRQDGLRHLSWEGESPTWRMAVQLGSSDEHGGSDAKQRSEQAWLWFKEGDKEWRSQFAVSTAYELGGQLNYYSDSKAEEAHYSFYLLIVEDGECVDLQARAAELRGAGKEACLKK